MNMTELLPCPFKHKAEPKPRSGLNDDRDVILVPWLEEYAVVCTWCGAMGPSHNTEEEAIEAWNKRCLTLDTLPRCDDTEEGPDLPDPFI
jgi:hypothetical protein